MKDRFSHNVEVVVPDWRVEGVVPQPLGVVTAGLASVEYMTVPDWGRKKLMD